MKKDSKLSKLKMPEKRSDEMDLSELDQEGNDMESADSEFPTEEESEPVAEGEEMMEASPLADLSDDELMAEVEKRGLMSQLPGEEEDDKSLMV